MSYWRQFDRDEIKHMAGYGMENEEESDLPDMDDEDDDSVLWSEEDLDLYEHECCLSIDSLGMTNKDFF